MALRLPEARRTLGIPARPLSGPLPWEVPYRGRGTLGELSDALGFERGPGSPVQLGNQPALSPGEYLRETARLFDPRTREGVANWAGLLVPGGGKTPRYAMSARDNEALVRFLLESENRLPPAAVVRADRREPYNLGNVGRERALGPPEAKFAKNQLAKHLKMYW
jgi:hypothetical protein